MVWGYMGHSGIGNLVFIHGNLTARMYVDVLHHTLKDSARKLGLEKTFIFQQDNDPKHTAGITKEWLLYNVRRQLKTPPQSPNINLVGNLWHLLDHNIRKYAIAGKENLKQVLQEELGKLSPDFTRNLVESAKVVIKAHGLRTRY